MDLVIECCENVPVYIFSCTKDEKAVDFLHNSLKTEGILSWDYQTIYDGARKLRFGRVMQIVYAGG